MNVTKQVHQADQAFIKTMEKTAIPTLRVALGIVYLWFGLLKVCGVSPAADLVAKTLYFLPKNFVVPFVGSWEIIIGLGLLFRVALRLTVISLFMQIGGTFLTFITRPDEVFQNSNPFRLTQEGEFVLKNLILLAAGVTVGSTAHRQDEDVQSNQT